MKLSYDFISCCLGSPVARSKKCAVLVKEQKSKDPETSQATESVGSLSFSQVEEM